MQEEGSCVLLHQHWDQYIDGTVRLICSEWPSSETVRRSMLQKDREQMLAGTAITPVSVLWVRGDDVLSHAKVIESQPDVFVIESVVTDKTQRGKGYGRRIVECVCEYLLREKPNVRVEVFLMTKIPKFYEKAGFETCQAPTAFGKVCASLDTKQINSLADMLSKRLGGVPPMKNPSPQKAPEEEIWMKKVLRE